MERFEIGDDERFAPLLNAARRGGEVVLTQHGEAVASVAPVVPPARVVDAPKQGVDMDALRALRARFAHLRMPDATVLIREMREMDDH